MSLVALYFGLQPHICNLTFKPHLIFYLITYMVFIINQMH